MISVTVKLDAGLGADLDNFTITAQPSATVIATGVSRSVLLAPQGATYANVPDDTTNLDVASTGLCTNVLDIEVELIVEVPPDTEAPTEPILSTPTLGVDGTTVSYTWTPSTDNVGVTGYEVSKSGVIQATVGPGTLTYEFTGLTPNTEYQFSVLAFDAQGNKSVENFDTVTTTAVPITTYAVTLAPTSPESGSPICNVGTNASWFMDTPIMAADTQVYSDSDGLNKAIGLGSGTWFGINNTSQRARLADGYCSATAGCFG